MKAVLSSGDGGAGRRLWQFTPHFTEIGYAVPLSFTVVAESRFAALPEDDKKALLRAAADTEEAGWRLVAERKAANYAMMRENGVTIHAPSPALTKHLAAAADAMIADWERQAGPEAADILRRYRADGR